MLPGVAHITHPRPHSRSVENPLRRPQRVENGWATRKSPRNSEIEKENQRKFMIANESMYQQASKNLYRGAPCYLNVTASKSTYSHLPKHLSGTTTTAFVFVAASFHYFCWNLWVFWILNRVPFHPIPFNIINPTTSTGTMGFFHLSGVASTSNNITTSRGTSKLQLALPRTQWSARSWAK